MSAPFIGIIREGASLPPPYDVLWSWCTFCKKTTTVKRYVEGYEYHIEHVHLECGDCWTPIVYYDVLTEANLSIPQLAAG